MHELKKPKRFSIGRFFVKAIFAAACVGSFAAYVDHKDYSQEIAKSLLKGSYVKMVMPDKLDSIDNMIKEYPDVAERYQENIIRLGSDYIIKGPLRHEGLILKINDSYFRKAGAEAAGRCYDLMPKEAQDELIKGKGKDYIISKTKESFDKITGIFKDNEERPKRDAKEQFPR